MPRNLHRRVEVLFPVLSDRLRDQIRHEVVEPTLADNAGAYDMAQTGDYTRRTPAPGAAARTLQSEVLERVARRSLQMVPASPGPSR